jgi:hypothetical protein
MDVPGAVSILGFQLSPREESCPRQNIFAVIRQAYG